MTQKPLDPTLLDALRRLDESINASEDTAIRARWDYGHRVCRYYELKPYGEKNQLPKGVLELLASELGVCQSEVSARMKFARVYRTEDQLSTVIESSSSWHDIKQHKLSDPAKQTGTPRETQAPLQRAWHLLENIEPETLREADLPRIMEMIETLQRHAASVRTGEQVAA